MNNTKLILIVLLLVATGGAVWYFNRKGAGDSLADTTAVTGFEADDTAAYNQMIEIFKARGDADALVWINKYVAEAYKEGRFKINGKPSKAMSWHNLTYAMADNANGKFTNADGRKVLWDSTLFSPTDGTGRILNALIIKYTSL